MSSSLYFGKQLCIGSHQVCGFSVLRASSQCTFLYIFAPFMHTPHQLSHIVWEHYPHMPPNTLPPRFFHISLISVGNECSVLWGFRQPPCLRKLSSEPHSLCIASMPKGQLRGLQSFEKEIIFCDSYQKRWRTGTRLRRRDGAKGEGGLERKRLFLLQPVNRLMGASAGMSWYLSTQRERERYT